MGSDSKKAVGNRGAETRFKNLSELAERLRQHEAKKSGLGAGSGVTTAAEQLVDGALHAEKVVAGKDSGQVSKAYLADVSVGEAKDLTLLTGEAVSAGLSTGKTAKAGETANLWGGTEGKREKLFRKEISGIEFVAGEGDHGAQRTIFLDRDIVSLASKVFGTGTPLRIESVPNEVYTLRVWPEGQPKAEALVIDARCEQEPTWGGPWQPRMVVARRGQEVWVEVETEPALKAGAEQLVKSAVMNGADPKTLKLTRNQLYGTDDLEQGLVLRREGDKDDAAVLAYGEKKGLQALDAWKVDEPFSERKVQVGELSLDVHGHHELFGPVQAHLQQAYPGKTSADVYAFDGASKTLYVVKPKDPGQPTLALTYTRAGGEVGDVQTLDGKTPFPMERDFLRTSYVDGIVAELVKQANRLKLPLSFTHDDVTLTAKPGDSEEAVRRPWDKKAAEWDRKREVNKVKAKFGRQERMTEHLQNGKPIVEVAPSDLVLTGPIGRNGLATTPFPLQRLRPEEVAKLPEGMVVYGKEGERRIVGVDKVDDEPRGGLTYWSVRPTPRFPPTAEHDWVGSAESVKASLTLPANEAQGQEKQLLDVRFVPKQRPHQVSEEDWEQSFELSLPAATKAEAFDVFSRVAGALKLPFVEGTARGENRDFFEAGDLQGYYGNGGLHVYLRGATEAKSEQLFDQVRDRLGLELASDGVAKSQANAQRPTTKAPVVVEIAQREAPAKEGTVFLRKQLGPPSHRLEFVGRLVLDSAGAKLEWPDSTGGLSAKLVEPGKVSNSFEHPARLRLTAKPWEPIGLMLKPRSEVSVWKPGETPERLSSVAALNIPGPYPMAKDRDRPLAHSRNVEHLGRGQLDSAKGWEIETFRFTEPGDYVLMVGDTELGRDDFGWRQITIHVPGPIEP